MFLLGFAALLRLLQVKLFARDDFFDCRWYEITNRPARGNSCSDFRRRDIDFSINDRVRMRSRPAAAIKHDELNNCFQFGEATPFFQPVNVVFADQAVQRSISVASSDFLNSVNCVRRRRAAQLTIVYGEFWVAFNRRFHHC